MAVGVGVGSGVAAAAGVGVGVGMVVGVATGAGVGVGTGVGVGIEVGVGLGVAVGAGIEVGISVAVGPVTAWGMTGVGSTSCPQAIIATANKPAETSTGFRANRRRVNILVKPLIGFVGCGIMTYPVSD